MNKKAFALSLAFLCVTASVEARKSQPWYRPVLNFFRLGKEIKTLFAAISADDVEAAYRVINRGAKVNEVGRGKETPLHEAAKKGNPEMVSLLLEKGAQVNVVDAKGMTPLHVAAAHGHDDVVKMLLAKGARVNARNAKGETALHLAAKENCYSMTVAALIKGGANVNIEDIKGRTALQVASKKSNCSTKRQILAQNPKAVVAKAVAQARVKKSGCN